MPQHIPQDLGNPNKVASRYGAVSPQETEPLNQQSNSSLNNGVLAVSKKTDFIIERYCALYWSKCSSFITGYSS